MCIRDRQIQCAVCLSLGDVAEGGRPEKRHGTHVAGASKGCLLYTSDAADERSSVDLGGRRIIKKKKNEAVANT